MIFKLFLVKKLAKEANKQRLKDAVVTEAFLFLKGVGDGLSRGAKDFMAEIWKIVMK